MKIDPTRTSTSRDYGDNPGRDPGKQQGGSKQGRQECLPMIPHTGDESSKAKRLRSRRASKKRRRLAPRRIAERRARQQDLDDEI